jgi:hypothetical protein
MDAVGVLDRAEAHMPVTVLAATEGDRDLRPFQEQLENSKLP